MSGRAGRLLGWTLARSRRHRLAAPLLGAAMLLLVAGAWLGIDAGRRATDARSELLAARSDLLAVRDSLGPALRFDADAWPTHTA